MRKAGIAVVSVLVSMGVLDAAWLSTMVPRFYRPQLEPLLSDTLSWPPAVGFYVLYAAGVSMFVVLPSLDRRPLAQVALRGAAFGLVAYGTYDLTNAATIDGWSAAVTAVDMTWGAALTATVGVIAVWISRRLG